LDAARFRELVKEAVDGIPDYFRQRFANLQIETMPVAPPDIAQSLDEHPMGLLGVYQGVPYKRRGPWYGNVMPDRIIIFQRPIETRCRTEGQVRSLVREVVIHEVGHYFGLSEAELRRLQKDARDSAQQQE
jgi:predicted Zn-dependent protease with MMP-like domain